MTPLQNPLFFRQLTSHAKREALKLFLILFLPAVAIQTGLVYGVLKIEANLQLAALQTQESGQVDVASRIMTADIEAFSSDLMVLANAPVVLQLLENNNAGTRKLATELFMDMAREKQAYDQLRYLDDKGMEIIRVNLNAGKAEAVPEADLQDKGERYFFKDSIRLSKREIYVSPLDLNVEHGKVEIPYKPMIRLGTPVFNQKGEKKGVVISNVYGSKLIKDFWQAMGADHHVMLLNRDGDWLSSPDHQQEWGFMFGNAHAFARRFPAEWQIISNNKAGSFMTDAGLFTYTTIYPLLSSQRSSTGSPLPQGSSSRDLEGREYFWKALSIVPPSEIPSSDLSRHPFIFASYMAGLALLAALIGYLSITIISRRQWRQAVFENEAQLREITSTLGEGVYVLDSGGAITYANPEAERLLGWPSGSLPGKHLHDLFHHDPADGDSLAEGESAMSKTILSGQMYRNDDETFRRSDGTAIPVRICASPIVREGRIVGSVVAFQNMTEHKRSQEEIRQLAYYDTLTNIPNRRLLMDRLSHALIQARRFKRSLAIMFLDLDHFKEVNDTLGHDVGDGLLKVMAERMKSCLRSGDTIARQGGDEFVILLAEIARPEDATQVAEKLLNVLREPASVAGHSLRISGSIGVVIYPVEGTDDAQELMKKADIAMYSAKQAGRNCYRVYQK